MQHVSKSNKKMSALGSLFATLVVVRAIEKGDGEHRYVARPWLNRRTRLGEV